MIYNKELIKCYFSLIKQCKRELKNYYWIRNNFNLTTQEKNKINSNIFDIKKCIKDYKLKINQLTGKLN